MSERRDSGSCTLHVNLAKARMPNIAVRDMPGRVLKSEGRRPSVERRGEINSNSGWRRFWRIRRRGAMAGWEVSNSGFLPD